MNEILRAVPTHEIEKEKFIALQQFKWGFSRRTILEYVSILIKAGHINEEKNKEKVLFLWR